MSEKPEIFWVDPFGSFPSQPLVEAIHETLVEQCVKEEDPYGVYISRMRSQIYENPAEVSQKIAAGYKSIIDNMQ